MVVNLIKSSQMFSLTLPHKVNGRYWLSDLDAQNRSRQLVSIEADNGEWRIKSNKNVSVYDASSQKVESCVLNLQSFLFLKIESSGEKVRLFVEDTDRTRQSLRKIIVTEPCILTIGRADNNNLLYENKFVGSIHAKLSFDGENWSIKDENSKNGTYVNGYRVENTRLRNGDYIYIMGLKIVIGSNYFAINNPDEMLKIRSASLRLFETQMADTGREKIDLPEKSYFFRSPRFHREIENAEIIIDPPPALQKPDTVPMALMLGPSLTMGLTSVTSGLFAILNSDGDIMQTLPTVIMSISMLVGTVLWPILTKKHEAKEKANNERRRQEKYLEYLMEIGERIKNIAREQSEILNENLVHQEECVERIIRTKSNLWERIIGQEDFLNLRIGRGTIPLKLDLKYPEKKFTMDDDSLQNAMLSLAEQPKNLKNVPIGLSLVENIAVGFYGNKDATYDVIKSLILQMVSFQSYDELKIVLIVDEEEQKMWDFVKYIPHFWNEDKTFRFFASNSEDVKDLSLYFENNILVRPDENHSDYSENIPYYVVISTSNKLSKKCEALKKLLKYKNNVGFSAIFVGENFSDFPKETRTVIHVNANNSRIFNKDDTSGERFTFEIEGANPLVLNNVSFKLANTELDLSSEKFSLPQTLTFLEMFNVGKVEYLNSLTRWKESNPTKSLQTPIGVGTDGDLLVLDLHEKFQGPHGLVAGMTGSGKSEFIITYILSLAVNYHPDEVSFILIDYKGGGLADAFKDEDRGIKLPHLAGTITNLDGASIKRSLISIQSELRRRQTIFSNAKKVSNEGTMDIYKYQQLYRNKLVSEPLPHLFIISDEFAELKKQQPEFMDELISAARIGRSLGIHLILATQKPSGVVDDQIWSNSRFRVCLKVQEKADSQDMIKCSDAAEISQTGRFYLQVGFNELFVQGQSAWCGADYMPADNVEKYVDSSVQVIDNLGRVIMSVAPDKSSVIQKSSGKQIVSIVKYLSELADSEGINVKTLWLEPIPQKIYVDKLEKKYKKISLKTYLEPIVGEYDDPFNQMQNVLTVPLSRDGNCLVYGASGSGKEMFLTTMCYSLLKNHSAQEVNLYVMDFGTESLRMFTKAPHIGGVATSAENEKVVNLLKLLRKEIDSRKILFADYGGDYVNYNQRNADNPIPNIVVIVNEFSGFAEQYEDWLDEFSYLTREGVKYGIYFVVTANGASDVRYKIQQNFKTMITMQLNDPTDYSLIVGRNDGVIPSPYKGRGLVNLGNVFEFQTALCAETEDTVTFIRDFVAQLSTNSTSFAKRIPVLPETVDADFVAEDFTGLSSVPLGISKHGLNTVLYNFDARLVLPVISQELHETKFFAQELVSMLSTKVNVYVFDPETFIDDVSCTGVYTSGLEEKVIELFDEMVKRNNVYYDSGKSPKSMKDFDERFYVIAGLSQLVDRLSFDAKDKLNLAIENASLAYKIRFVVLDTAGQVSQFSGNAWYKKYLSGSDGLWIGDGFADQYVYRANKITSELYDEIGSEYGYFVRKNRPVLLKTLSSDKEGMIDG